MNTSLISVLLLITAQTATDAEETLVPTFESRVELTPAGKIDELVFDNLEELGIEPAKLCSDEVFVRRAYLDVIGTLPTAAEVQEFFSDKNPKKRSVLIGRLLEREEFPDYWAMKWCDLLRVKAEFPINLWPNGVQAYHRWIHTSIKENKPYDQFVREILIANGSNFRDPPVNFYRAVQSKEPEALAQAVALTFMGSRAENWPENRLSGMATFFSQIGYKQTGEWKEEIVFFDALKAAEKATDSKPGSAILPDGTRVKLPPNKDPREVFADWLITPDNPYFAGSIVNRIWYWLLGRGIVHEPDDIRPDNPPSNPMLLAYLEKELVAAKYDLKHVYRLILNSKTYQLASIPPTDHPEAEAQFAYYPLRRLDAEVLIDALCQITGTTEEYSSPIPEPFTFIPENQRSIALPDGSITSSFLEMFGRPPRDTGFVSERNNRSTASQRLHMLNSSHIREKIERSGRLRMLMQSSRRNPLKAVTGLYLTILSRPPTEEELEILRDYAQSGSPAGQETFADLTWALINSAEFLYRH